MDVTLKCIIIVNVTRLHLYFSFHTKLQFVHIFSIRNKQNPRNYIKNKNAKLPISARSA